MTDKDLISMALGTNASSDRFELVLYVPPGKTIGHRTITVSADGRIAGIAARDGKVMPNRNSAPLRAALVPRGADAAGAVTLNTDGRSFTLRLRIDEANDRLLNGAIYLCVNDAKRSYVEGRFAAHVVDDLSRNLALQRNGGLRDAIKSGDRAQVKALLKEHADPNAKLYHYQAQAQRAGEFGYDTPLTTATLYGKIGCITELLEAGADINLPDSKQMTPLMLAASDGNLRLVYYLLSHGASAKRACPDGRTPLHFAIRKADNQAVCSQLVAGGADINAADDNGSTPLIEAVRCEQIDMVRWLVNLHADVNRKDKKDHTAFYYADTDAVRVLLYQAGAKP